MQFEYLTIAIVDVLGTLGIAWVWARVAGARFWVSALAWFCLGIVAHRVWNVKTAADVALFG